MRKTDIEEICSAFTEQGWNKPVSVLELYHSEQERNVRRVFVAQAEGKVTGYATLLPNAPHGAFQNKKIPLISDFIVFQKYQRHGIGTAILDEIERTVSQYAGRICLGVGLHRGYGAAQRLYGKRGYVPDGSGVWYRDAVLEEGAICRNDDDLILYLSKELRQEPEQHV
jgi:GNAT superfamily N-acetyltransferase